jgi:hypothetical protein
LASISRGETCRHGGVRVARRLARTLTRTTRACAPQDEAKKTRRPWDMSKACGALHAAAMVLMRLQPSLLCVSCAQGFDNSAPVSALVPVRARLALANTRALC